MNQSPVIETREHETTENCWCAPILEYSDPQTGNQIWVHNNTPNEKLTRAVGVGCNAQLGSYEN
jgi:hypothetical protein